MTMAGFHLDRADSPLAAYNALQVALMRRFVARGGTVELWCVRLAPAFRRRYGWMLEEGP
jgi:hypothetical protein